MTIAHDLDRCGLPDHEMTYRDDEFVGVGDGSAADLDDHIVLEDAALFRGTAGFDVGDLGTCGHRIAHRPGVGPSVGGVLVGRFSDGQLDWSRLRPSVPACGDLLGPRSQRGVGDVGIGVARAPGSASGSAPSAAST